MTHWLAQTFPAASVTGLDLSLVPKLREQLANVRYLKGNVLQQRPREWISESGDRPLNEEKDAFDLVFSRLLVAGIGDWQDYIAKQFALLKPGGWTECQEPSITMYNANDEEVDDDNMAKDYFAEAARSGLDLNAGAKIKGLMEAAGFEMVKTEPHRMPMGSRGQPTEELRAIGDWQMKNTLAVTEASARRNMRDLPPEHVEKLLEKTRAVLGRADGWHIKFYVTYGRKPE